MLGCGAISLVVLSSCHRTSSPTASSQVPLKPCRVDGIQQEVRCGVYNVFENRRTGQGRTLPLKIVVIPARNPRPERGPIFYMAGGPGETATELADLVVSWGDADEHDVVLVDERGTGDGHRLDCRSPGSDDNLQGYLNGPFEPAAARACRDELSKQYDLTQYSTEAFVEDIDEIRRAMGYDKINLNGGSFGTYAALMYIRRHGENVRSAYLSSLVTLSNRVPLYHAQTAQEALEQLFSECEQDTACHSAYPNVREQFARLMNKVREAPIVTSVRHPTTGASTEIHLTERAFGDAVRVMLYRSARAREVPFLIERAMAGDFTPFAELAVRASRDVYSGSRMGLHFAITCNEFVSRIRPEDVEPATRGSFLGAWRVKDQMAACADWPKTELPADYFEPFRSEVPAVLVSGETDGTGPRGRWGDEVKAFMPNALHVVVPGGGHTPENECSRSLRHAMFRTGTTNGVDAGCMAKIPRPSFKLPSAAPAGPSS